MATRKKGLGRGLEALLGPSTSTTEAARAEGSPSELRLAEMVAGQYQPRTRMDEGALYELAESIKAQGIMQPILVRKLAKGQHAGKYEIIAGERRFRAAHLAGLTQVPVLVRDVDDHATAAMALIENMQREDLNPLEEAQGLQRLIREFGLTHEQAAQAIGRGILWLAPWLMKFLSIAGTAAMFLVGGGIIAHGVPWIHHLIQEWTAAAGGGLAGTVLEQLCNGVVGIVTGGIVVAVVTVFKKMRGTPAPAAH